MLLKIPDSTPLIEIARFASSNGLKLVARRRGYVLEPSPRAQARLAMRRRMTLAANNGQQVEEQR